MPGKYQYNIELKSNVAKLLTDMKEVQDRLDTVEGREYKIKLNVDEKKLSNVISNLEKMLGYLGKGTGDFKQFENLSKQLSSITTDINNISKAFSVMNDGSDFANSIKSIDTSLTALSNHFVSEMSGRMTSSIKEVKSTLSDIGDGGELAPLLQTINKIENAINELSTSVKGIGLNMNIDVGSDSEMEAKVQSKIANALQAYQRLFDHIKMSSAGGQIITDKFFDFDINQYDTMMGKLQAYKKFIDNMRKETKAQFNGQDVLYQDTEKSFWTQASSAWGQVTKVFNEMKSASGTNPLADIFGKTDLSEVISQLGLIVAKLEEISTTASSFKNVFGNGFNVTASVEEIDKLTNRVKELEDELSKIKLNPVSVDKSNISSGTQIKDAFQGDNKVDTDASTVAIKEESQALEQVSTSAKDAASSKEKFAKANKEVKASADSSKTSISEEEKYFNSLGKSLTQYQNTLTSISRKPANGNRSQELQEKIDIISSSIEKLNALKSKTEEDGYVFNKDDVKTGEQLEDTIKKNIELVKQMSSAQKGSDALSRGKEIDTITKYLNKFTGISKQAKQELKGLLDQLQSDDPSVNVKKIHERFLELTVAERNAGREARNLFDIFKDKKIYSFIGQAASMFSFYDLINGLKQVASTVRELDTAYTEMRKVSDESAQSLKNFQKESFSIADSVGTTALAMQDATATWMRLGESLDQAKESAKDATILLNVSEFENIDAATDSLVAMSQAYKELDKMEIIDVLDKIGNEYSISTDQLSTALKDSAAVLKTQGNDLAESVALITAGKVITCIYRNIYNRMNLIAGNA